MPILPLGKLYHNRLVPVAVNAVAVAFWQYAMGVVTIGAFGIALIVIVAVGVIVQLPTVKV